VFTLALFAFVGNVEAQNPPNCNQGANVAEKTWEKWGPWQPKIQLIPFKAEVAKLRQFWNWIASNSSATVGPRRLEIDNQNETGNILGKTKSTFVTHPSFNNKVTITIEKFDGKAKTGVTICTHERNGTINTVTTYQFPNENSPRTKTFVVNNAKGKIISVAMENHSVGNKFKYRIKAD